MSNKNTQKYPVETVEVLTEGSRVGIDIVGGTDTINHPYGTDDPDAIFISRILPDGAASRSNLSVGEYKLP